jgi:hypothetical protein
VVIPPLEAATALRPAVTDAVMQPAAGSAVREARR